MTASKSFWKTNNTEGSSYPFFLPFLISSLGLLEHSGMLLRFRPAGLGFRWSPIKDDVPSETSPAGVFVRWLYFSSDQSTKRQLHPQLRLQQEQEQEQEVATEILRREDYEELPQNLAGSRIRTSSHFVATIQRKTEGVSPP